MQFHSFTEFFSMGGYAGYVWSAFGVGVVVLVGNLIQPMLHHKKVIKQLAMKIKREQHASNT
tara:strand:- start:6576 stop:6761 length:186 start_codon:yes stop_codon:yes gene_type:complete